MNKSERGAVAAVALIFVVLAAMVVAIVAATLDVGAAAPVDGAPLPALQYKTVLVMQERDRQLGDRRKIATLPPSKLCALAINNAKLDSAPCEFLQ